MRTSHKAKKTEKRQGRKCGTYWRAAVLFAAFLSVFCFSAYQLTEELLRSQREQEAFKELSDIASQNHEDPNRVNRQLYEMNPDLFGWIFIEGTEIDYPVMYSPERPEYYLDHDFDGAGSDSGVPFMDSKCLPEGNYFLIYGHHMKNGTMFGCLPEYADKSYCEEHPVIRLDTLHERREYQVIAAFYSRVYDENEPNVFRYYEYTDLSDRETFDEFIDLIRKAAIYDTGFEAAYGDGLLVLSTCNYHTENGRFVVAAKRIDPLMKSMTIDDRKKTQ